MNTNHRTVENQPFILIVDDIPGNLKVLGSLLKAEGYHFTAAMSGTQALNIVKKRLPNLILLDVMMPEMDGFEVCRVLKASPETSDIPVIFLTAKTELDDIVAGLELGAVDYVTKPFRKEELLARVNTHITLQQAKVELQELNATKDKFFSIIAHDLRGPFNGFLGLTEFMIQNISDYPPDQIVEMLTKQHKTAKNLYALLENLLAWSRLQRDIMEYAPTELDLDSLVYENVALFHANAEHKGITLENLITQHTIVYADENIINTVVRNLLSNALKFTKAGGTIEISAKKHHSHVEVAVSDSGIGIEPEVLGKLFRIDVTHSNIGTAGERGTGLGLILCKELVEKNEGNIWVESELGKGTTFRFTVPVPPS